ncbi:MAG: DMT family transporter [Verrucomicrobia bacterium]|nr:DMT family transporter [Verrucomicrobiota bacterium]
MDTAFVLSQPILKTISCTALALTAFAANSVLCRLALGNATIDASGFTIMRLLSGAITLLIIIQFAGSKSSEPTSKGSWWGGAMLFIYAITFSFAYLRLETGTGALILFGWTQITIILVSLVSGNRLHITEWLGVIISFLGFVYLVLPNVATPSLPGFFLMTLAGIAWGLYTLNGRGSKNPLMDTGFNFLRTVPMVLVVGVVSFRLLHFSTEGIILACLSGGIASGIGYTIWYIALRGLSATQAGVVQLLVPVIAALGGVVFVFEYITLRLTIASTLILGGIFTVILGRNYFTHTRN